jgi:curved DNA-binding protein CbpA
MTLNCFLLPKICVEERRMKSMKKWFKDVKTIEELRKKYRELLKLYHPDNEKGSVELTQEINAEYDRLFVVLSNQNMLNNKSYTYEENEQFKVKLNEIIGFNMTIEIIGSWIWCFDCYPYKDKLKGLGFTWCSKKKAWIWHDEPYHRYHKKEIPLSHIREKYGSDVVNRKTKQKVID